MYRFLKIGNRGKQVVMIQSRLRALGFDCKPDGNFGTGTMQRVIEFQLRANLNADGVVGPITWKALGLPVIEQVVPSSTPNGREEIEKMFGNPLDPGYWKEYGGFCATPPELDHVFPYTFAGENGFWCNKLLISIFQKVYKSIVRTGLASELHTFNGCFNIRNVRGGKELSTHSWGIAVDHDSETNKLGHKPEIHVGIVNCFTDNGFIWGGNFSRQDGMHFQYATNY